jgi:RHS repeat-associated protein
VEVRSYDTYRQQPIGATLGVNNSDSSRLGLGFNYCASGAYYCPNNNGNLQSQTIGLLGASQTYGYDGYNRLSTSTEKTSATTNWSENFNYDSFGNRWVLPNPVGISLSAWTVTANYYNSSTNRLTFNNFGYDNAGNQTTISPYAVSYDVENRQTGFTSTSNGSATYTYDGDGRRVTKTTGGVTTTYVYDAGGNLAAEYSSQPPTMPCQTCYLTTDHLGSTRVITDQNGNAVSRHDFLPFGEELVTSNRTAALDYGVADNVMHRYTGQQRDLEGPGLDFFRARYFHGAQGRFTSPDPSIPFSLKKDRFQAWIWNPQHWNKYAYALNNPFLYVDPSGMVETIYYWLNSSLTDEQKQFFQDHKTEILDAIAATLKQAGTGSVVFKDGGALSESQVENILETQPKGVAFINIANKSYAGQAAPSDMFGATQGIRSVVFVGNLQADNPNAHELILRIGQVADHELGHGMGFFSRGESTSFIMFWNRDLMNEGQGMPSSSSPRKFDMSIPQNRQAVDEINKLPEYKPQ